MPAEWVLVNLAFGDRRRQVHEFTDNSGLGRACLKMIRWTAIEEDTCPTHAALEHACVHTHTHTPGIV